MAPEPNEARRKLEPESIEKERRQWKRGQHSYRNVTLVDKVIASLLGNEQNLVEEEESSLVAHAVYTKGGFQDQFPIGGQVWTLPVNEQ